MERVEVQVRLGAEEGQAALGGAVPIFQVEKAEDRLEALQYIASAIRTKKTYDCDSFVVASTPHAMK